MKKAVFFPYHPDLNTILTFRDKLIEYEMIGVISFKEDHKIVEMINMEIGTSRSSEEDLMSACDVVIILENYRLYREDKYRTIIERALCLHKEVLITPTAAKQICIEQPDKIRLMENLIGDKNNSPSSNNCPIIRLKDISTPTIAVVGQGKNCDKFMMQVSISDEIQRKNYAPVVITSNPLGALFGFFTIPSMMFDNNSLQDKIFMFNQYIYEINKQKNPDVLLIGVPEGIMPFETREFNHFAEYAYVISRALTIDIGILCTYFLIGQNIDVAVKIAAEYCEQHFDIPIVAATISRTVFEIPNNDFLGIIYEHLSNSFLKKYYPSIPCFEDILAIDINKKSSIQYAVNSCIQMLENNIPVI